MAYSQYATISATTLALLQPPPVPTWLTPIVGSDQVTLRWSALSDATGYVVEWRESGGSWDTGYAGANTQIKMSGLLPETDYEFRVKATNEAGASGWDTIFVQTKAQGPNRHIRFGALEAATPQGNSKIQGV